MSQKLITQENQPIWFWFHEDRQLEKTFSSYPEILAEVRAFLQKTPNAEVIIVKAVERLKSEVAIKSEDI